jgi:hypothetical protein
MKTFCIVRSLFSALFSSESTIVDAIRFSTDAHSFVKKSERSILERDVLKRSVNRSKVF